MSCNLIGQINETEYSALVDFLHFQVEFSSPSRLKREGGGGGYGKVINDDALFMLLGRFLLNWRQTWEYLPHADYNGITFPLGLFDCELINDWADRPSKITSFMAPMDCNSLFFNKYRVK